MCPGCRWDAQSGRRLALRLCLILCLRLCLRLCLKLCLRRALRSQAAFTAQSLWLVGSRDREWRVSMGSTGIIQSTGIIHSPTPCVLWTMCVKCLGVSRMEDVPLPSAWTLHSLPVAHASTGLCVVLLGSGRDLGSSSSDPATCVDLGTRVWVYGCRKCCAAHSAEPRRQRSH